MILQLFKCTKNKNMYQRQQHIRTHLWRDNVWCCVHTYI